MVRWAEKPASSQCNVRLCETRYSTASLRLGQCGQIHETLKGSHRLALQLQIWTLIYMMGGSFSGLHDSNPSGLIPTCIDHDPRAHLRRPIVMMRHS